MWPNAPATMFYPMQMAGRTEEHSGNLFELLYWRVEKLQFLIYPAEYQILICLAWYQRLAIKTISKIDILGRNSRNTAVLDSNHWFMSVPKIGESISRSFSCLSSSIPASPFSLKKTIKLLLTSCFQKAGFNSVSKCIGRKIMRRTN